MHVARGMLDYSAQLQLELASMLACMFAQVSLDYYRLPLELACALRGWFDYHRLPRELACLLLVDGLTITDSRASWRARGSWNA